LTGTSCVNEALACLPPKKAGTARAFGRRGEKKARKRGVFVGPCESRSRSETPTSRAGKGGRKCRPPRQEQKSRVGGRLVLREEKRKGCSQRVILAQMRLMKGGSLCSRSKGRRRVGRRDRGRRTELAQGERNPKKKDPGAVNPEANLNDLLH